jgi:hypothetical protein
LRKNAVSAVFLGSFFDWDVEKTHRVSKDHGFLSNTQGPKTGLYNYADIDCDFISIHHWMKWYKFGFTRLMDNLSLEIRRGRLSRSEAIEIVRQRGAEFPESDIEKFCRFVGIEQAQFFHIAETFRNKSVWSGSETYWWIPDFLIDDFDWNKQ